MSLTAPPLLAARNVTFAYGSSKAIFSAASVEIRQGTFNCIVGESGIGKTTLLKLLYGQIEPQNGHVLLSDVPLSKFSQREMQMYRRICGVIFQDSFMIPGLSIRENISLPSILNNSYNDDVRGAIYSL